MAKPDLDDGYLQIAHELLAAVMAAHIPQEARVVLFEVFSQVYGPAKLKLATLRPVEIARRTGLKAPNISRGITFLLEHAMLRREGLSTFAFLKNYDAWEREGRLLLTPNLSVYAAFAPVFAMSHKPPKSPKVAQIAQKNRIESDIKSADTSVSETSAELDSISNPIRNPISQARFDIESDTTPLLIEDWRIKKEETTTTTAGEFVPPIVSVSNPEALEPFEAPPPDPIPALVDSRPAPVNGELRRPFTPDPVELDRIRAWVVETLGNDNPAVMNVGRFSTQYPLDWIEQAIEEALSVSGMTPNGVWRYAYRCLSDWWKLGGPPKAVARVPRIVGVGTNAPAPPRLSAFAAEAAKRKAYFAAKKSSPNPEGQP